jgi:membrane fusion protein, multidrug efflux system
MKFRTQRPYGFAMVMIALLSLVALSGCRRQEAGAAANATQGPGLPGAVTNAPTVFAVSVSTVAKGELQDYLEFGGDVTARTSLDITPDTSGRVAEVRVELGAMVQKDQIVAMVDPSRPGLSFELSPVRAPMAGTITAINVVAGSMVSPQLALARVARTDQLQVSMPVAERFVAKIRPRQRAVVRFDAYPGERFEARVSEISPVLDPNSRTMGVKLEFSRPDPRIKAGMFARITLITEVRSNTVIIPEQAVINRFGETFVFVVEASDEEAISNALDGAQLVASQDEEPQDEATRARAIGAERAPAKPVGPRVRRQIIRRGIRVDDLQEVLEGLQPGDLIVVRGQSLLEDGSPVNVVSQLPLSTSQPTAGTTIQGGANTPRSEVRP